MPWSPKCMLFINTASSFSAAFSVLQATLNDKMKGRVSSGTDWKRKLTK